jgi:hypothetical protein
MAYKFINGSNFAQKHLEFINHILKNGCKPEEFTDEQIEVMRFYFGDKLTSSTGKTKLAEEYLKDLLKIAIAADKDGKDALFIAELANVYADFWGVE